MKPRKRKRGGTSWGVLLGIGGVVLVLVIGVGVAVGVWVKRSGSPQGQQVQQPSATPSPGTPPPPGPYDEWTTFEPTEFMPKRTAWVRIKKVFILDKWYRRVDRLQQELPAEWRANSPAEADAIILVKSRQIVEGMGNATGDGKVITFTPFDMEQLSVIAISPRKEVFGQVTLNANQQVRTVTATMLIKWLEGFNREVGKKDDPTTR